MLIQAIINFAFGLNNSSKYKDIKSFFYNILSNSNYPYKKYFDSFMIILITISISILVYEVKIPVASWIDFFDIYIVTSIFLVEYILRFWVYNDWHLEVVKDYREAQLVNKKFKLWTPTKKVLKGKLEFIFSPPAIIDLLAILPAYRPLRVLRIFVLFRVFKLLRYAKSIHQFVDVLSSKRFELLTLLFLLFFLVATSGIAIYVFEEQHNDNINSLFDAIYWSFITISTVGYGDISPVTYQGRVISMLVIISGIAMISFLTSIIVSAFSEKLDELKENRMIEEINKKDSFMIIGGYGQMIRMFLKTYKGKIPFRYIIIERDISRVEMATKDGYSVLKDDASSYEILERFKTKYSKVIFLALTRSDINNIYMTLNAKAISRNIQVITRASSENMAKKCYLAGASQVLMPNMVANRMLITAITQPAMYRAIYTILTGEHIAHLDEVEINSHQKLIGKSIKDIDFKSYKLLFIGMESSSDGKFIFNPPLDTKPEYGDTLLIMGQRVSIEHFKDIYLKSSYI